MKKDCLQEIQTHGKYNMKVLQRAVKEQFGAVNYLIKIRNETFDSPRIYALHKANIRTELSSTRVGMPLSRQRLTPSSGRALYVSRQKQFFQSKRLLYKVKEKEKLEKEIKQLLYNQLYNKSDVKGRLQGLLNFTTDVYSLIQEIKECKKAELLLQYLKDMVHLIEANSCFIFLCGKMRYTMGKFYCKLFMLQDSERNLLFAQLLSRSCLNFEVTMQVLDELIRLYMKQSRIEEANEKAINLLYLAVKVGDEQMQAHALSLISICYFYEGNIAKSSFYYNKSLTGIEQQQKTTMLMSYDNNARITKLQRIIAGQKTSYFDRLIANEVEPYDNQKFQTFVKESRFKQRREGIRYESVQLKRLINQHPVRKIGIKAITQGSRRELNLKNLIGNNSSQIYKTHRSSNRQWQNFILQLFQSKTASVPEFLMPNDVGIQKDFQKLVWKLEVFISTLENKAQQELDQFNHQKWQPPQSVSKSDNKL